MIRRLLPLVSALLLLPIIPARAQDDARYLNADLPVDQRVDDLVGRMTLEEKVSQMNDVAPAIERLGIPAYNWWNEALHGVARSGLATVFPQAVGLAATWNPDLIFEMASAISDEARAKHHAYARENKRLRYQGLTIWSPNINLFRDPRWGRGQETYGEDPHLTARLAVPFVRGLQGDDPTYLKTVATVKHFAVHSGPEPERHVFDAIVNERDLREYYLPQFEAGIVEAGAYSLMCAYNSLDGTPACASRQLLQEILRDEWGFDGYVVSDCWAVNDIFENHRVVDSPAQAAAVAVRAGTDLDCGSSVYPHLTEAVSQGLITEASIDRAVKRLMKARFRLGMFDPEERVAYAQIPYEVVDSEAHRALARRVARESLVLLKNDGTLPLRKDLEKIAVIGPNADQWLMLLGNYNGVPGTLSTPLEGIRSAVSSGTEVVYAQGSEIAEGFPVFSVVPGSALETPTGGRGLHVDYFANRELTGDTVGSTTAETLDANWYDSAPRADLDDDDFGVRWTGALRPEHSGTYQLGVISTSRFELYFEDSLLVRSRYNYMDELGDPRLVKSPPLELEAGRSYDLRLDAGEGYGDAQVQLLWAPPRGDLAAEAVAAAEDADAVVLFLGLTPAIEGEEMPVEIAGFRGGDRTDVALPEVQEQLMQRVVAVGKPTILVLLNGSALAVNWAEEHVNAILEAWYPGQAGGNAIADVLFGDYNPAGRLPVTFYRSVDDLPPFEAYSLNNRTYQHFAGEALYPFGHGLSYTTFEYAHFRASSSTMASDGEVTLRVDVTNTGTRAGDEVVQLYVSHPESAVHRPIKELKGFARVHLEPGETRTVTLPLEASELAYWDAEHDRWAVESRPVRLQVGASSTDVRAEATIQVE